MKNIAVSKGVWRRLCELRNQKGFKHFSKTIEVLLDNFEHRSFSEEKTSEDSGIKNADDSRKAEIRKEIEKAVDEVFEKRFGRDCT
jgi:hypothetical protein